MTRRLAVAALAAALITAPLLAQAPGPADGDGDRADADREAPAWGSSGWSTTST
jgi:hypothetical protein